MMKFEHALQQLQDDQPATPRKQYLDYISRVLEMALYKFEHKQTKNSERIRWGRLIVHGITAGTAVLKDQDLEALQQRLQRVEAQLRD
jgi:hypothetical protein